MALRMNVGHGQKVTTYETGVLPFAPVQVNVLVASSKGYTYAVGQAFFRNASHGSATLCQFGLSFLHENPGPVVFGQSAESVPHPQQSFVAPLE
jgi:hypothetical protein